MEKSVNKWNYKLAVSDMTYTLVPTNIAQNVYVWIPIQKYSSFLWKGFLFPKVRNPLQGGKLLLTTKSLVDWQKFRILAEQ